MTLPSFEVDPLRAEQILDERASALAAVNAAKDRVRLRDAVALRAGTDRFAIPLSTLSAVVAARQLGVLPTSGGAAMGLLYERGDIWVVYSLAILAGGAPPAAHEGFILLLRRKDTRAAIFVDALEGSMKVNEAALSPIVGDSGGEAGAAVARLVASDGLLLIDEDALWRRPELLRRKAS